MDFSLHSRDISVMILHGYPIPIQLFLHHKHQTLIRLIIQILNETQTILVLRQPQLFSFTLYRLNCAKNENEALLTYQQAMRVWALYTSLSIDSCICLNCYSSASRPFAYPCRFPILFTKSVNCLFTDCTAQCYVWTCYAKSKSTSSASWPRPCSPCKHCLRAKDSSVVLDSSELDIKSRLLKSSQAPLVSFGIY